MKVAQVAMKSFLPKSAALILILGLLASGCSKSGKKDADNTNGDSAPITNQTKGVKGNQVENAANLDPYSCQRFYQFLSDLNTLHLQEKSLNPVVRLQIVVTAFVNGLKKDGIKIDDYKEENIKENDCTEIEKVAGKLSGNKDLMKAFGETESQFDPLAYVYEHILYIFTNSLDRFSTFYGERYMHSSGFEGAVNTGFRFLSRADYYDVSSADEKNVKEGRHPPYLYVEQTPDYLKNSLPRYSKIYKIGDKEVKDMNMFESLARMSRKGSTTLLVSIPEGTGYSAQKNIDVKLQLQEPLETGFRMISQNPNIGYLKISSFNKKGLDSDLFKSWIEYLLSNTPAKLDGTIIDLRTNTGGRVDEMQKFAGTILTDPNTIISHRIVKGDGEFFVTDEKSMNTFSLNYGKIVVLTDFMTASASEMLVAALQDYKAGLIVGETSIGKGIGQRGRAINSEHIQGEAHVTNFYMASPSGKTWYLDGIKPDIEVKEKANDGYYWRLRDKEKTIPGALKQSFDYEFDPNVEVRNKITDAEMAKLKAFRENASNEPEECKKSAAELPEEQTCIYAWGLKILTEWIKMPAAQ